MINTEQEDVMTDEEKDAEVDRLCRLYDGMWELDVECPMCNASFFRSHLGRVNTCSEPCQVAYNDRIFELDGGRTIHRVADLTPARAAELLGEVGIHVGGAPGPVVPS